MSAWLIIFRVWKVREVPQVQSMENSVELSQVQYVEKTVQIQSHARIAPLS